MTIARQLNRLYRVWWDYAEPYDHSERLVDEGYIHDAQLFLPGLAEAIIHMSADYLDQLGLEEPWRFDDDSATAHNTNGFYWVEIGVERENNAFWLNWSVLNPGEKEPNAAGFNLGMDRGRFAGELAEVWQLAKAWRDKETRK